MLTQNCTVRSVHVDFQVVWGSIKVKRSIESKGSLSIKLKKAGWSDDYLRSILNGLAAP